MRIQSTKGQGALEFLMTYGWALLLLIVAILMAWQLGLFNIGGDIAPGSLGFWGLMPADFKMVEEGNLSISFVNEVGGSVNITDVQVVVGGTLQSVVLQPSLPVEVPPGSIQNINTTVIREGEAGGRFEVLLAVDYLDNRTLTSHRSSGRLWGSYEK
ncbi:MAG: hypothetical protein V1921_04945 [Candidatus Altiarchaeota archaeon]